MIVIVSVLIGVTLGIRAAKRRNGGGLDLAQYAAGYGIAFALLGIFVTILFERLAG